MIPLAAVTDEFTQDLDRALDGMAELGMTGVELRMLWGRNIIDCSDEDLDRARTTVERRGMRIVSIASPILKCVLPDGPPVDPRFQQDVFGSSYTAADQPRLAARAFEILARTGARLLRVFSYWRTVDPPACLDRVVAALSRLADEAAPRGVVIGLENEHACNIATGGETARLLSALDHPALQVIWDPANASILGERPYPDGFRQLPLQRIVHVHAKDCNVGPNGPTWGPIGEMSIDWSGQVAALAEAGYERFISLETHWRGPHDDKFEASMICGRALGDLVRHATTSSRQP
jgi:sugar phosphate isomerase/epimerase